MRYRARPSTVEAGTKCLGHMLIRILVTFPTWAEGPTVLPVLRKNKRRCGCGVFLFSLPVPSERASVRPRDSAASAQQKQMRIDTNIAGHGRFLACVGITPAR